MRNAARTLARESNTWRRNELFYERFVEKYSLGCFRCRNATSRSLSSTSFFKIIKLIKKEESLKSPSMFSKRVKNLIEKFSDAPEFSVRHRS